MPDYHSLRHCGLWADGYSLAVCPKVGRIATAGEQKWHFKPMGYTESDVQYGKERWNVWSAASIPLIQYR